MKTYHQTSPVVPLTLASPFLALAFAALAITPNLRAEADPFPPPRLVFDPPSDSFYADLRFPRDGDYSLEFSVDAVNWVIADTYLAAKSYFSYYFYDFKHPRIPRGFYRLRDISGDPSARDAWFRMFDHPGYACRRRILVAGEASFEVLELKDLLAGTLREIARVPGAHGGIAASFDVSADGEYIAYGIIKGPDDPQSTVDDLITNRVVIQSLRDPSKRHEVSGDLKYVRQDRQNRPASLFYLSLQRHFFTDDSGLYLDDSLHVYSAPEFHTVTYGGPYLYPRPNVTVGSHQWIGLAASVRVAPHASPEPGSAPFQGLVSVYDTSGGLNAPVLLHEFRAGECSDNSPPFHVDEFFRAADHGYVILVGTDSQGLLVDPIGKRSLPLATNASSYRAFPYQTTKARIIGDLAGKGTADYVYDPAEFSLTPFAMASSSLLLEDKDNPGRITQYGGSDNAYQFSTAAGAGVDGSNALAITYAKSGYPYAHGVMQVEVGSLDFSAYTALSLKVKNTGSSSQTWTGKFEAWYPYNGVRWSFEKTFAIEPGADWTEVRFSFPDDASDRFVLADSCRIVFFADVGKANTTGSFLFDDIKLLP